VCDNLLVDALSNEWNCSTNCAGNALGRVEKCGQTTKLSIFINLTPGDYLNNLNFHIEYKFKLIQNEIVINLVVKCQSNSFYQLQTINCFGYVSGDSSLHNKITVDFGDEDVVDVTRSS
jgi:hypothetical protein